MKFEYLEVRPCIESGSSVQSFQDETEFYTKLGIMVSSGATVRHFWTLYGMAPEAVAIGDFTTRQGAFEVLNAILAPMAAARDLAEGDEFPMQPGNIISPAERAAYALSDFINQSSNAERI